MALTLSGTNGVVGAGFTVDASGVSVTAGVGTFSSAVIGSIGAGVSVPAAGLTGALPTISAANCTNIPAANITGTLPAISGANLTGITAGITEADQWQLNSDLNISGTATDISSNWTRSSYSFMGANAYIGTGMSESSGIFTFPSTGKYLIMVCAAFRSTNENRYVAVRPLMTTDNSSYQYIAVNYGSTFDSGSSNVYSSVNSQALVDVTNVSTHKVRFSATGNSNFEVIGHASEAFTSVIFMKLGDT